MAQLFANGARAALSASIAAGDTTLSIASGGALFPVANTGSGAVGGAADWFKSVLDDGTNFEIVYIRTHTSASTSFTNVLRGQEGSTALSFAAGAALGVRVTAEDMRLSVGREMLTAVRTYYVRTDGADANTGLANTAGGAFLTIQRAVDVVAALDTSTNAVTIQVADGTYTGGVILKAPAGSGARTIAGNLTTPANVLVSTTGSCFTASGTSGSQWTIKNLKVASSTAFGLYAELCATLTFEGIVFGACVYQIAAETGGVVLAGAAYTISGGGTCHFWANAGGIISAAWQAITLSGTPAFSAAFCITRGGGIFTGRNMTFSGTGATGSRYQAQTNGVINTEAGGASYFPGNAVGTTATGGVYA